MVSTVLVRTSIWCCRIVIVVMDQVQKFKYQKAVTIRTLNPAIIQLEYGIYGPLYRRLVQIEKDLEECVEKPFKFVIKANIGDCHALGQSPISFIRQVVACVSCPEFIENIEYLPKDVKSRATEILNGCYGYSVGSYTSHLGIEVIRRSVANYIEERDNCKADWNNVYLSPGATAAIKSCLKLFIDNTSRRKSGVMIPIPQYPQYIATLTEYGLVQVHYYLDESNNWALTLDELERSYEDGSKSCKVRVLVVINPGNPTGQILTRENMETIIKFAYKHSLLICADEVYQHNVYKGKFYSFKKVLTEIEAPYNQVELISMMSTSKGYMGECGFRGGWIEVINMDPEVKKNFYKSVGARHSPNTLGQAVVHCVVKPPTLGEESYELYMKEKSEVLQSFALRAKIVEDIFNNMDGFSCNSVQGAMYAFPRVDLPPKAITAARLAGQEPDEYYSVRLLEETGICVVPGSEFGQVPGTHHIRSTILPQIDLLKTMADKFQKFHKDFIKEFS